MDGLKRLIREIHRRSLWQVLGIYAVGAWIVLQVVDVLAEAASLPEWFPTFALALIILGLPVVLATAFVQEGGPSRPAGDGEVGEGSVDQPSHPLEPRESPGLAHDLFTWKNAVMGGVMALALWGVVAAGWIFLGGGALTTADRVSFADGDRPRSIAVLPFADMSAEGDQEYFGDGIAEEILNALTRIPDLRVAARTSAFAFKGKDVDVRAVGDSLGVSAVLEGSVRKAGDRVRITAQLIEVEDGFHLWSDTYDRRVNDVFAVQDEIARAIVSELEVTLTGGERLVEEATASPEAHDEYLRGRYHWNQRGEAGIRTSIDHFRRAIALDSTYALAWAGLADAHVLAPNYYAGLTLNEVAHHLSRAEEAARRALELDPGLAEAYTSLGYYHAALGQPAASEEAFRRALEIRPGYATAHQWYSNLLCWIGRFEESEREIRRALELDPLSVIINRDYAMVYLYAGRWEDALRQVRHTLELNPDFALAYWDLFLAHLGLGRYDEAEEALGRAAELMGGNPEASRQVARLAAEFRRTGTPPEVPPDLVERTGLGVSLGGGFHAVMGQTGPVVAEMEEGMEVIGGFPIWILNPPLAEHLQDDPRWRELVRRAGLERWAR